jgi:hypothetical protein
MTQDNVLLANDNARRSNEAKDTFARCEHMKASAGPNPSMLPDRRGFDGETVV